MSFFDALFTATSAICVTGLIVQDTATCFTPFGHVVILTLIQLGGLGVMTFSTLILLVAGQRISMRERIIIQEGFHHQGAKDVVYLIRNIFLYTFIIEAAGMLSLFLRWQKDFPWLKALALSAFHSISAFCNAGFSLFSENLLHYRDDVQVNMTIILLILFGGLGFLVLQEMSGHFYGAIRRKRLKISLHSKLVLIMTSSLIVFSFVLFLLLEWNHSFKDFTLKEKILSSLFQAVTPRTAGFNTVSLNSLSYASIFLLMVLMFIGACPGSTGGGVKTSTIGVIIAFLKSKVTARDSVNLFYRTLPQEAVIKAFTVVTLAMCVYFISFFVLFISHPWAAMREVFFEVYSAFGTVGLSLGITPKLTDLGKVMINLTMYVGRIGPLTLLYAFSREKAFGKFDFVEESVMIG